MSRLSGKARLVGTYPRHGTWVTVWVETRRHGSENPEEAYLVLERSERPGTTSARMACELGSLSSTLRHAEAQVLARGGVLGVQAVCLAGSPVEREAARRMFDPDQLRRWVHLPVGRQGRRA